MKENRLIYIDIAKGIGIFLVILGHMPSIVPEGIRWWIFSFHMPLFFLISGMFAKLADSGNELKVILIKRVKNLLGPYFFISTIFLILDIVSARIGIDELYFNIINILLGMQGVQWYLYSLFFSNILFAFICFFCPKKMRIWVIIAAVNIALLLHYIHYPNYFQIGSGFYGLGFYYLGYYLKNKIRFSHIKALISMGVSVFISAIIVMVFQVQILDMKTNYEIDIVFNYILAYCGSYMVIYISYHLSQIKQGYKKLLTNVLENVGKNSIIYFPLTWYIPGFLSDVISENLIVKILSYIVAFLLSWLLSRSKTFRGRL